MSKPAKPAPVQFYVDADVLGLAKILAQIRADVTYPGDPGGKVKGGRVRAACPIADVSTRDDVWIPETARQGWLIITRPAYPGAPRRDRGRAEQRRAHGHPGGRRSGGHVPPA